MSTRWWCKWRADWRSPLLLHHLFVCMLARPNFSSLSFYHNFLCKFCGSHFLWIPPLHVFGGMREQREGEKVLWTSSEPLFVYHKKWDQHHHYPITLTLSFAKRGRSAGKGIKLVSDRKRDRGKARYAVDVKRIALDFSFSTEKKPFFFVIWKKRWALSRLCFLAFRQDSY